MNCAESSRNDRECGIIQGRKTAPESAVSATDFNPGPNRPHLSERGSAVGIMLPSESDENNRSRGWRADDLTPADVVKLLPRFRSYFTAGAANECWEWQGHKLIAGYGVLSARPRRANLMAHRIAWVAATGEALTDNLTIDHLCFNPPCVNPTHLEPVTMAENVSRARRAALGGRLQTRDEELARLRKYDRNRYWADPEKQRARRAVRKPCPECGGMYRSSGLAKHRRTHGGAA